MTYYKYLLCIKTIIWDGASLLKQIPFSCTCLNAEITSVFLVDCVKVLLDVVFIMFSKLDLKRFLFSIILSDVPSISSEYSNGWIAILAEFNSVFMHSQWSSLSMGKMFSSIFENKLLCIILKSSVFNIRFLDDGTYEVADAIIVNSLGIDDVTVIGFDIVDTSFIILDSDVTGIFKDLKYTSSSTKFTELSFNEMLYICLVNTWLPPLSTISVVFSFSLDTDMLLKSDVISTGNVEFTSDNKSIMPSFLKFMLGSSKK